MNVTELVAVALLVGCALLIVAVYARRRVIARGERLVLCAERPGGVSPGPWRPRFARYSEASLDLFTVGGLSLTATTRLERGVHSIAEVDPRLATSGAPQPPLVDEPVLVRCLVSGRPVDLAVSASDYPALRAWIESARPGDIPHEAA